MQDKFGYLNLFFLDVPSNIKARNIVCDIVLKICKGIAKDKSKPVQFQTKVFIGLSFGVKEIIVVIKKVGEILMVNFSFSIMFEKNNCLTIQDLGSELWKYMSASIKYN